VILNACGDVRLLDDVEEPFEDRVSIRFDDGDMDGFYMGSLEGTGTGFIILKDDRWLLYTLEKLLIRDGLEWVLINRRLFRLYVTRSRLVLSTFVMSSSVNNV
jgi:hypothetical protein